MIAEKGIKNEYKIKAFFYERVPRGHRIKHWQCRAYQDYNRHENIMVIFPLHYLVIFIYWLNYLWFTYRGKETWIDKKIKDEKILESRNRELSSRFKENKRLKGLCNDAFEMGLRANSVSLASWRKVLSMRINHE